MVGKREMHHIFHFLVDYHCVLFSYLQTDRFPLCSIFYTEIQLTGSFNPNILYKLKEKIRQKFSSILSSPVGHEKK